MCGKEFPVSACVEITYMCISVKIYPMCVKKFPCLCMCENNLYVYKCENLSMYTCVKIYHICMCMKIYSVSDKIYFICVYFHIYIHKSFLIKDIKRFSANNWDYFFHVTICILCILTHSLIHFIFSHTLICLFFIFFFHFNIKMLSLSRFIFCIQLP